MRLRNARLVLPAGVVEGSLDIRDGKVAGIEPHGPLPAGDFPPRDWPGIKALEHDADLDAGGCWVFPGFVDLHVHGGDGFDFSRATQADHRGAAAFHASHGTTSLLATTMSAPLEELREVVALTTAEMTGVPAGGSRVVGCHLEGPYLNPARRGAQPLAHLRAASAATTDGLLDGPPGTIRVVTLAPEIEGGMDLVRTLRRLGIVASIGHSDADYVGATAAFDAGATHVTHLCNGMRPLHHREPGILGAAVDQPRVTCELIADGVHVHPSTMRVIASALGTQRLALVTDATPAAGLPDGDHSLGGTPVTKLGSTVSLADGSSLAGSALTMDAAVRNAIEHLGVSPATAARMASTLPAQVAGIDHWTGSLEVGKAADLVVMNATFAVLAVMIGGRWMPPSTPTTQQGEHRP